MVLTNGIKFATHLIASYYGDLCSKVCECLLSRGPLTLAQTVRFTELSRENVVNCLRVLIHQNCVQAFSLTQEGGYQEADKKITQYMAIFDNIINKSRAAKFKQIVSDEFPELPQCLEIFEGLLQHGRLSMNQIIDRSGETAGNSDAHVTKENFYKLLSSRFVERCPDPEPDASPPPKDDTPGPRRGSMSAKIAEERLTLEQRAMAAAAPMEASRFFMEMDGPSGEKVEEKPKSKKVGNKRKQDVLNSEDGVVLDTGKNKEVLWRVNFEEFIRRLRHKACISHVKARINNEAAIVLSAMIKLTRFSDMGQKAESTEYLSTDAIFNKITDDDVLDMDKERIELALEQLGCQTISSGLDETYSIDLKGIIEGAQIEEVESVVLRRYGREAYRIFRLLSKAGRVVETDKISDTTFIDKKDNLKILYKLWKDNYVQLEKVFMGSNYPTLLWRVNKQSLWKIVLDEMFHGALNLRLRLAHEQERGKEVLLLPRDKLVGEQAKKYSHLQRIKVILESNLIELDDSVMLFQDL